MGTEKVEAAIQAAFPKARVQRMDSDIMTRKTLYRDIFQAFRVGKIDILVGTQMIAKGLHFPNVTLVGIVYADMALHLPDFRAGERTFQLLVQVAGRAGRGDIEGEVIVQSFTPFHAAIQYARQHDYLGFYEQEIEYRRQLRYPPLTRLICLTLRSRGEEKAKFVARALARELKQHIVADHDTMGEPTPAPLARVQNHYRYQIIVRTDQILRLVDAVHRVVTATKLPEDVFLTVDVDPISLL
jgi:primosomal protein N' (replication factor Y)